MQLSLASIFDNVYAKLLAEASVREDMGKVREEIKQ